MLGDLAGSLQGVLTFLAAARLHNALAHKGSEGLLCKNSARCITCIDELSQRHGAM